jgi:hypothetical protein
MLEDSKIYMIKNNEAVWVSGRELYKWCHDRYPDIDIRHKSAEQLMKIVYDHNDSSLLFLSFPLTTLTT